MNGKIYKKVADRMIAILYFDVNADRNIDRKQPVRYIDSKKNRLDLKLTTEDY